MEKLLNEYLNTIKSQEQIINSIKTQLEEKDEIFLHLKKEFNEVYSRYQNTKLKLSYKEEENQKFNKDSDNKINSIIKEKEVFEFSFNKRN